MSTQPINFEVPAKQLALEPLDGKLIFTPKGLAFYPLSDKYPEVLIPEALITDLSIDTTDTRKEKPSLGSLFFLGELALAYPKETGSLFITITVQTATQQMSFLIDTLGDESVRSKMYYYFDTWRVVPR